MTTTSLNTSQKCLEPLESLLHSIVSRLDVIESKLGVNASPFSCVKTNDDVTAEVDVAMVPSSPALVAYDEFLAKSLLPLIDACMKLSLEDAKMKEIGEHAQSAFDAIRRIIILASLCKRPSTSTSGIQTALGSYIKPIQDSVSSIQKIRTTRDYDIHQKSVVEMLSSLSWVVTVPPPKTPSSYVNDILGATEFWSNKIRKTFKGVEGKEIHIKFCDCLKVVIQDLTSYTKEFHPLGLSWNPKGCETIEEASKSLDSSEAKSPSTIPEKQVEVPSSGARGGGMAALVTELSSKITSDGSSAATGLRNVTREQQTWRKEYNPKSSAYTPSSKPAATASASVSISTVGGESKSPIFLFDTTAQKWRIEYQNGKSSTSAGYVNSNLKVQVQDVKEQVYIYQCQNITIEINGKCKTIVIDGCSKVQVVFGTAISSCEVVNSKRIQVQTLGVCPTFAIDKTDGCLIFLSKETMTVSSFVTSKSSEMNVCFCPSDSEEFKELPLPEQFHHRIVDGLVATSVSDLYH